ncbi:hypothetical protein GGF32_009653 [Allomyces javanicus]|nr:hypothetical protein GGF32_009653 [Allomyces javanicus]
MDLDPTPTSPLDPEHDLATVDDGSPEAAMDDVPAEGAETLLDVAHGLAAWSLWKQLLRSEVGQRTSTDMALHLALGPQPGILWPNEVEPRDAQIGAPKVPKSHPQRFLPIPTKFMDDSGLLSDLDGDESSGSDSDGVKGEESDDDADADDVDIAAAEAGARSPSDDRNVLDQREEQWDRDLTPYRARAPPSSAAPAVPFDFFLSSSGSDSGDADDLALPAGVRRSAPDPSADPIASIFSAHRAHPSAPALDDPRAGPRSDLHNQMVRQATMSIHETETVEYDGDFVDMLASHVADSNMDQVDALLHRMADTARFVLRDDFEHNDSTN